MMPFPLLIFLGYKISILMSEALKLRTLERFHELADDTVSHTTPIEEHSLST